MIENIKEFYLLIFQNHIGAYFWCAFFAIIFGAIYLQIKIGWLTKLDSAMTKKLNIFRTKWAVALRSNKLLANIVIRLMNLIGLIISVWFIWFFISIYPGVISASILLFEKHGDVPWVTMGPVFLFLAGIFFGGAGIIASIRGLLLKFPRREQ